MGDATTAIERKARKAHVCSWCGERIKRGEAYRYWAWFDEGTATTVKMHPECWTVCHSQEDIEFYLYENTRGCLCHRDDPCCAVFNDEKEAK